MCHQINDISEQRITRKTSGGPGDIQHVEKDSGVGGIDVINQSKKPFHALVTRHQYGQLPPQLKLFFS